MLGTAHCTAHARAKTAVVKRKKLSYRGCFQLFRGRRHLGWCTAVQQRRAAEPGGARSRAGSFLRASCFSGAAANRLAIPPPGHADGWCKSRV